MPVGLPLVGWAVRRRYGNLELWSPATNRRPRTQLRPGSGAAHQVRTPGRATHRHDPTYLAVDNAAGLRAVILHATPKFDPAAKPKIHATGTDRMTSELPASKNNTASVPAKTSSAAHA